MAILGLSKSFNFFRANEILYSIFFAIITYTYNNSGKDKNISHEIHLVVFLCIEKAVLKNLFFFHLRKKYGIVNYIILHICHSITGLLY